MGRVPRWSSRVALTLLLWRVFRLGFGFSLCGDSRICRECKGWTWGGFPLSKRQETGSRHAQSRHATCHIATCRPLLFPSQHPWSRHGDTRRSSVVTSRIQARYNGDLGRDIPKKRGRYCTSVPGRKTTAQDVRRIQAIFRRGDVDKKKEKRSAQIP